MGFLRAACSKHDLVWPRPTVLDTAKIARATLLRDEVPNNKLATLARHVGATVQPTHRALDDARATVDVLHYLIGRVGDLGVTTVEELASLSSGVRREQRRKRTLADGLPPGPGVYSFIGPDERVLYVGKSAGVRARVRNYFTAAEKRSRMAEMVRIAERVDVIECATPLEAEVREARLIAEHRPAYNRRSKFPDKQCWIRLTDEPFPRLSVVRMPSADDPDLRRHLGPFPSRTAARVCTDALAEVFSLRTCTDRIPLSGGRTACAAAELGRCPAPCDGSISVADYGSITDRLARTWTHDFSPVEEWFRPAMAALAEAEQFERAARLRHRLTALASAVVRADRYRALAGCSQITAGRWVGGKGWEVHVIRHGRLAGAAVSPPGNDPISTVATVERTSEDVPLPPLPTAAASADEVAALWRWLTSDGVRLISVEGELTSRSRGAARMAHELQEAAKRWQLRHGELGAGSDRKPHHAGTSPRTRHRTPDPRRVSRIAG